MSEIISVVRFADWVVTITPHPSNELLGYSHSVRFTDWICVDCVEFIHE